MSLRVTDISQPLTGTHVLSADGDGRLVAPDSEQLFGGDYTRSGNDLYVSADGLPDLYIPGYFRGAPADIMDASGAVVRGPVVAQLAGPEAPAQYAQTGGTTTPGASPVGQVETLEGATTVQRTDGSVETLQVGSQIYQQDVVQTADGGSVSITFVDGTIFTLASASRMVIDELIYDPGSASNSGGFSLLQGSFVFIAGQVAKTGGMEVSTPSSTMGIRGTTVLVEVTADGGVVTSSVTLTRDPDGSVGRVELRDVDGNLVATLTDINTKWLVSSAGGETREVARTLQDDADDNLLIAEAFAAFRSAVARVDNGDTFVTLSDPGGPPLGGTGGNSPENSFQVDSIDEPDTIEQPPDVQSDDADTFEPFDDGLLQPDLAPEPPVFRFSGLEDATVDDAIAGVVAVQGGTGPLTYSLSSPPATGNVTVNADGSFEYVPAPDFNGQETFALNVLDDAGETSEAIVVVEVLPVNDAPAVSPGDSSLTGAIEEAVEDTTISGMLFATDVDAGSVLTWSIAATAAVYGTFAVTPQGVWSYTIDNELADPLRVGEMATETLTVTVTDEYGATDSETVSVLVTGTNDVPTVSRVSVFETTQDTDVAGTLTAGDIDGAGIFSFAAGPDAPANGTAVINPDGSFSYTPDTGFVGVDRFTYTVTDEDGGQTEGRIEVEVENTTVDVSGASVSVDLNRDATADTAAGAVAIDVDGDVAVTQINLSVLLDSSGSIPLPLWNSLLDSLEDAMNILIDQFAGSATVVEVQFTSFGSTISSSAVLDLMDPDLSAAIRGLPYTGTGTNWRAAFTEAGDFLLEEAPDESNYLLFVTDGRPSSGDWQSALSELTNPSDGRDPVEISAFGFGDVDFAQLQLVDPDAVQFVSPSDLSAALQESPLFTPELVDLSVRLEVDGTDLGVISDETSPALQIEGLDYELPLAAIENIAGMLGEDNRITIEAGFDTDGDKNTVEFELTSFDSFGRADTAQTLTGLDGHDLLFGSNEDDSITGGDGNDVILAFDGDDTISAGAGNDSVLAGDGDDRIIMTDMPTGTEVVSGGAGRDVLEVDVADINALLAATDLSGIEAIDMDNGRADALSLSLVDIVSFSDEADADLEALLGSALPESITVYGETGDLVDISTGAGGSVRAAAAGPVNDGAGNAFTIYEYVDSGGEVLATLAVESAVTVASDGATV
ncbi:Ig-like domain-containing protein [Roseobacter sp. S98]|uniref:Ig-like domain-containing protein n=1 Tax=Roseobacter algicola (ex Choi et al. 2025) (nom. illeg.) TaxID=3092138 RepID=UPI003F518864